jgi:hypothetical protein
MRKFLIVMIIALSLLLCLASCGDEEVPTVPSTNAPADSGPKQLDQCRWVARIHHEYNGFWEYYLRIDGENSEFGKTIWTSEPYFSEDSPGFQVIDGKIAYGLCGTMIDSAQVVCEENIITVTLRYCVLTLERIADHQLKVIASTEDQIGPTSGLPVGTVLSWDHSSACTSCVADTKCDYCGKLLTAAPGHSYADGSCIRCGQAN